MNNVKIVYTELCSVSIEQPFYRNKFGRQTVPAPAPDLQIIPMDDCNKLLNRLEMGFKAEEEKGGFIIFGRVSGKNAQQEDLLRFIPGKKDILRFWVRVENPDVLNFDDLPVHIPTDTMLFLSNDQMSKVGDAELHLTKNISGITNDILSADYDWVQSSGASYRYHHPVAVAPDTAKIRHISSGAETGPKSLISQAGGFDLTFDLSALPIGMCELRISGTLIAGFYFIGSSSPSGLLGIIELSISDAMDNAYRIVKPGGALPAVRPEYMVKLRNRETQWRYTVKLELNSSISSDIALLDEAARAAFINKLNITTNNSSITFSLSEGS